MTILSLVLQPPQASAKAPTQGCYSSCAQQGAAGTAAECQIGFTGVQQQQLHSGSLVTLLQPCSQNTAATCRRSLLQADYCIEQPVCATHHMLVCCSFCLSDIWQNGFAGHLWLSKLCQMSSFVDPAVVSDVKPANGSSLHRPEATAVGSIHVRRISGYPVAICCTAMVWSTC